MELNKLRKEKNISQFYLAKKLNVKQSCISFWEKGKREPNLTQIYNLSKILGCSIDEIVMALLEAKHQNATKKEMKQ